jgi:predicted Zn-dependent protease
VRNVSLLLLFSILTPARGGAQQASTPAVSEAATRAEQALRGQDTAAAMREYRAMIAADPRSSRAWTALGVLLYGSGRAAEAAEALAHALQIDPAAPRAELFLAFSQADMRECGKALPALEKYFSSEPVGKLQRLTGLTLLQCSASSKDPQTALRVAAQLKENYPGDADVLYETAELFTRMWTETADELLTAHPDSYRVHQLAAEVNEAQGNLGRAILEYRAALRENAALPQMHYRIGQLILREGEADADEKAMAEFRAELTIDPQSAVSALAMGEIERHQGKLPEANADYTRARTLEPDLPEARVGLAQTLLAEHQVDAAQAELRALIAKHPGNAQAHYAMMLSYREQGKLPEAAAEMATFQRLQRGSADQFQKKLNALLAGSKEGAAPAASSGSTP